MSSRGNVVSSWGMPNEEGMGEGGRRWGRGSEGKGDEGEGGRESLRLQEKNSVDYNWGKVGTDINQNVYSC